MANIDPNIALGVKPLQVENPMNQYAALSQIQNAQNQNIAAQNQNALAQYQLSAAKRGEESTNIQNQLYAKHFDQKTGKVNQPAYLADLAANNQGSLIPKALEQFTELEHKENVNKKNIEDTKAAAVKNIREKTSDLQFNPSNENIIAHAQDAVKHGVWTQQEAEANIAKATALPMDQRPAYFARQGLNAEQRVVTAETEKNNAATRNIQQQGVNIQGARLSLEQNKANREQTIGNIPAGYRLSKDGTTLEAMPGGPTTVALPPKELQKREASFPQATSAVKAIETKSDSFINDLKKLRDHPGLNQITGIAAGRLPAVTGEGRAAQALYDKIVAKGGFQALQDLRDASKTGGALGNVSNQEGKQLTASFAAINRVQDAKDVRAAIDQAIGDVEGTKTRVREAYNQTYEYKNGANPTTAPVAPTPTNPASNGLSTNVTTPDGKVFTFPTPEAAALFKQKTGIQ